MTDLSKRLREMAVNACSSEGLTVDDAVAGLTEAAVALDVRDATHVDKADAWDAITAKRPRWQTVERFQYDGNLYLFFSRINGLFLDTGYGDHWLFSTFTHWHPLPAPPEQEEECE